MGGLLPGGWPELMAHNRALALGRARCSAPRCTRAARPGHHDRLDGLAPVAGRRAGLAGRPARRASLVRLVPRTRCRTWLYPHPLPLLRISAQLYNDARTVPAACGLLAEALHGG